MEELLGKICTWKNDKKFMYVTGYGNEYQLQIFFKFEDVTEVTLLPVKSSIMYGTFTSDPKEKATFHELYEVLLTDRNALTSEIVTIPANWLELIDI